MSLSARHLLPAVAVAAFAVAMPTGATAAPVLSNNACTGSDGQWGTLPLELSATAAQNGRNLDVSAIQPSVSIPSWLPAKLSPYAGAIALATGGAGTKNVGVEAWMAVAGKGSTDTPQILKTTGTIRFTLSTTNFVTWTVGNPSLTLAPAAATTWRAPDAGGAIDIAQAPAGSLPAIPGGAGNATVQPKGSLWIRGSAYGVSLTIDCQPGTTPDPQALGSTFTPGIASTIVGSVFAAAPAPVPVVPQPPAPVVPQPPAPVAPESPAPSGGTPSGGAPAPTPSPAPTPLSTGTLAIASPSLKFGSAAVLVSVSCPAGGPACSGSAVITSAKKLKVGSGPAKLRKLAAGTYTVKAGASAPVKLKLTSDGKKLKKTALVAVVTLRPASGAVVTKRVRAN